MSQPYSNERLGFLSTNEPNQTTIEFGHYLSCANERYSCQEPYAQWRMLELENDGRIRGFAGQVTSRPGPEAEHMVVLKSKAPTKRDLRARRGQKLNIFCLSDSRCCLCFCTYFPDVVRFQPRCCQVPTERIHHCRCCLTS